MQTLNPLAAPLYVMAKPAGSSCNLACDYCYYLEKEKLYSGEAAHDGRQMSDATLEAFIRQYMEAQTQPQVLFTWHGGEPLLRPLRFYRTAVALQRRHGRGRQIDNCLQTNGTLLTDEWCRFFRDEGWLIGISIDGPQELHDALRRSRGGMASWQRVMRGIELLERHGVAWNAMGTVNSLNAAAGRRVYRFYKSVGCRFIQFTPVVERLLPHADGRQLASPAEGGAPLAPFSVTPEGWGRFACEVFDEWIGADVGEVFVQLFDATLARWVGEAPGVCSMAETCGHAAALEAGGDLYACDHFVFPEYRLGNIHREPLAAMMYGERQQAFGRAKREALPQLCRTCKWCFACNGGCPKDRFALTPGGEAGLNYLCRGYRMFFEHAAPWMDFMSEELMNGRPPANVMDYRKRVKLTLP